MNHILSAEGAALGANDVAPTDGTETVIAHIWSKNSLSVQDPAVIMTCTSSGGAQPTTTEASPAWGRWKSSDLMLNAPNGAPVNITTVSTTTIALGAADPLSAQAQR